MRVVPAGTALMASSLTALVQIPWSEMDAFPLSTLLLFGPALLVCVVARPFERALEDPKGSRAVLGSLLLVGALCFGAGAVLSNIFLIDGSLQRSTLLGYAVSAAIATSIAWRLRNVIRRVLPRLRERFGIGFRDVIALACAVSAVSFALIDVLVWPDRYWNVHLVFLATTLISFCGFALAISARRKIFFGLWAIPAVLALIALPTYASDGYARIAARSAAHLTAHRRLVLLARSLSDGDGDGFSDAFGGGDCDDGDPAAFPLSLTGRDCFSWGTSLQTIEDPLKRAPSGALSSAATSPRVVLLVTIDAYRCAIGNTDGTRSSKSCPNIARLGAEGRARLDAHTSYPATRRAFGSLHTGASCYLEATSPRFLLARWMSERGYRTHVVATHQNQLPGALRESFDSADESLVARAELPTSVTSESVTDLGLAYLRSNLVPGGPPLFLWLHYFDAHAPYVATPGSSWISRSEAARYEKEVRRVDAAIGRLAAELRRLPAAGSTALLLTADHGEQFGEHGYYRHGSSIYEEAIHIPMLVWSPDPRLLASVPETLPANHAEISPFLVAMLAGQSFLSSEETFSWVHSTDATAFGLYAKGHKLIYNVTDDRMELFDLVSDPFERVDLSRRATSVVQALGPRLLSHLKHCEAAARQPYHSSGLRQTWLSPRAID